MFLADYIILTLLLPLSLSVLYLFFLALVGISGRKQYPLIPDSFDFLILVPAHNEEKDICKTLDSLSQLEPLGKIDIVVIADNCSDKTAAAVRSHGTTVLERFNTTDIGKGYALEWAISQYNLDNYDAVAIVDADTIVDKNMLKAMAQSLVNGAGAVQVYYGFVSEQKTHLANLQHMASISENILFYNGRAVLNLPILLRGNGMAVKAEVLKIHPWDSFSITEDVDYAVNLIKKGITIDFNINSKVISAATSSFKQSASQKIRWAGGTIQLIKEKVFGLIFFGLSNGKPKLAELGFSFFLLSRPLLIYLILIVMSLSILLNSTYQIEYIVLCLTLIFQLIIYNLAGIFYMDDKWSGFKAICFIPFYGIWFLFIQIIAIAKSGSLGWVRTERKPEE